MKHQKKRTLTPFINTSFRTALIAAGLAASLNIGLASAATPEAAMPQAHSDTVGAAITDTAITAQVKTKLMGEDSLNKSDISVTTTNGVVTLTGTTTSSDTKSTAGKATMLVEGVKSVDNALTTPKSSKTVTKTKRAITDSWITTKVKSELLADSVSKGFKVSVKTVHGVVVLSGALANEDAIEHVKDVAGKVDGVKSVDTSALIVVTK